MSQHDNPMDLQTQVEGGRPYGSTRGYTETPGHIEIVNGWLVDVAPDGEPDPIIDLKRLSGWPAAQTQLEAIADLHLDTGAGWPEGGRAAFVEKVRAILGHGAA